MEQLILFDKFIASGDSLWIFARDRLIFSSKRPMLLPLLDYIEQMSPDCRDVTVFDKVGGNAAALLCVKARCIEIYSPVGSRLAIESFEKYGVKYHFSQVVPCILKEGSSDLCPMEKLSVGKSPDDFYSLLMEGMI